MPPVLFVGKSAPGIALAFQGALIQVPSEVREGDMMIAIIGTDTNATHWLLMLSSGWVSVGSFTHSGNILHFLMKRATADEPASYLMRPNLYTTDRPSVIVAYRDVKSDAPVATNGTGVTASTNFSCPSLTLTTYSDLYVGAVLVAPALIAVAPPVGAIERHEDRNAGNNYTLQVFDVTLEAAGASGAKVSTVGSARTGIAAALLLDSPPPASNRTIDLPIPGAIGLPTEGV